MPDDWKEYVKENVWQLVYIAQNIDASFTIDRIQTICTVFPGRHSLVRLI